MTPQTAPEGLIDRLRSDSRFLITSHINPDGDAIGTAVGLSRLLGKMDKTSLIWIRDEVPPLYRSLPGSERIHTGAVAPPGFPGLFDSAIVLECPTLDRCGLEAPLASLPMINIDHHLGNQHYGVVHWVDVSSPAVGEMVFRLAVDLETEIDAEIATALYLALVTDTGGFRFANASAGAFRAAASMVDAGARPEQVSGWLHESRPEAAVRLIGEMLQSLRLHHEGSIASALLTRDMFLRTGADKGDSEGLIDYPRSIAGVRAVAMLRELGDRQIKVSLRSSGSLDIEPLARRHGGGGHPNAAGLTADGEIEEVRRQIVDELAQEIGEQS